MCDKVSALVRLRRSLPLQSRESAISVFADAGRRFNKYVPGDQAGASD